MLRPLLLPKSPRVVLVVSNTTVISEPEDSVVVTGTTTAAVVCDIAGSLTEELIAVKVLARLAVKPSASDEFEAAGTLDVVRIELGRDMKPVGPA